jgi:DNA-binding GntR family transcriptional regulator
MARLATMVIVQLECNRGIKIVEANTRDLQELFQLRLMVEVPATFRAVHRKIDAGLTYRLETELTAMGQAAKAIIALIEQSEIELEQFRSINVDFLYHDILFHKLLIERSDNMRLVASVNHWRDVITAQRGWPLGEPRDLPGLYDEHERILQAARDRDPYGAAQAKYEHLRNRGIRAMEELHVRIPMRAHSIPHGTKAFPSRDTSATQSSYSSRWVRLYRSRQQPTPVTGFASQHRSSSGMHGHGVSPCKSS